MRTSDFKVGDRVYYKDNGPFDTGTIIDIEDGDDQPIVVKWDVTNHPDERVDSFSANQLEKLSE